VNYWDVVEAAAFPLSGMRFTAKTSCCASLGIDPAA